MRPDGAGLQGSSSAWEEDVEGKKILFVQEYAFSKYDYRRSVIQSNFL
jgi:hypothetical protein